MSEDSPDRVDCRTEPAGGEPTRPARRHLGAADRASRLLVWYDGAARELPWRRTKDPYLVWVSEIMLQQTRTETVLPYFERFVRRFPGVGELAAAEIDDVLALWSGLGYYRRARQMHRAARRIARRGGEFPRTAALLRELPGVGPYTAAAVASIAFGESVPVLDGNVVRVLARWLGHEGDPRRAAARRELLETAAGLLDHDRPGDSNQAMMELGATVCRPRAPRCGICPLEAECVAAAAGEPELLPRPVRRRATERRRLLAAIATRDGRVLLFKRPEGSRLLAGTWEIPWVDLAPDAEAERALGLRYGGRWTLGGSIGRVRHGITFRSLEVEVREASFAAGRSVAEAREAEWVDRAEIGGLPASSLVGKALEVWRSRA